MCTNGQIFNYDSNTCSSGSFAPLLSDFFCTCRRFHWLSENGIEIEIRSISKGVTADERRKTFRKCVPTDNITIMIHTIIQHS